MSRYDLPGQAAAQFAYDNAYPYDDAEEAREEWIAERTDELVAERMQNTDALRAALQDVMADDTDALEIDLCSFMRAVETTRDDDTDALAAAAVRLWKATRPQLAYFIQQQAEADATNEHDTFSAEDGSEARAA